MGRKSNTYRCKFCLHRMHKKFGTVDMNKDFMCKVCLEHLIDVLVARGITADNLLEEIKGNG